MTQIVTPYLLYEDGEAAIEFLSSAFGFREVDRATGSAGGLHAELEVSPLGGRVYLGQPTGEFRNPGRGDATSQTYVIVADVAAHFARAKEAGAEVTEELTDLPFGHRRYGCIDPQGHEWFFAEVIDRPE